MTQFPLWSASLRLIWIEITTRRGPPLERHLTLSVGKPFTWQMLCSYWVTQTEAIKVNEHSQPRLLNYDCFFDHDG